MSDTKPEPMWDWVTARAKCSAVEMIETLRECARQNTITRNDILDESGDRERFKFKDTQNRGFTVFDTWGRKRRAVDVTIANDTIHVSVTFDDAELTAFDCMVTLNDAGQCRFRMRNAEELDAWHILKRALEPIFFEK